MAKVRNSLVFFSMLVISSHARSVHCRLDGFVIIGINQPNRGNIALDIQDCKVNTSEYDQYDGKIEEVDPIVNKAGVVPLLLSLKGKRIHIVGDIREMEDSGKYAITSVSELSAFAE